MNRVGSMLSSHSSTVSASSLRSIMPFSVAATALKVFSSMRAGADISACVCGGGNECVCMYVHIYIYLCVCVYVYI